MRSRADKPLKAKGNMEMYGMEGLDGRGNRFYKVPWVERQQGIEYRCAAGRVAKAVWCGTQTAPRRRNPCWVEHGSSTDQNASLLSRYICITLLYS